MITVLTMAFLGLLLVETGGTAVFLVLYVRRSDWRSTPVGRHLAAYSAALLGLLVVSLLSTVVRSLWMVVPMLLLHAAFAVLIWQRVVLLLRAQRADHQS